MIIDGHAHVCKETYGSIEELLRQYEGTGISKAVLVPGGMLDVRKMTKYIAGEELSTSINPPNQFLKKVVKQNPDIFYALYCVNPHLGEKVLSDFEYAIREGYFSGLKLAPMAHQFSLSSEIVLELANLCAELDVPFYSHVVFSPAANTKKFLNLVKKFPKTKFILGHMGFGPADIDAVNFALNHENVFFETSDASFLIIKEAVGKLGAERVIFGSEFPMYHPAVSLQNIIELKCTETDKDKILHKNILSLLRK